MKRKLNDDIQICEWNGNIISVFKIVAYHGFDNMKDISMFSTISKYFYDWMNENVILRCTYFHFLKLLKIAPGPEYHSFVYSFPRLSLLKIKKEIVVDIIDFLEPQYSSNIEEFSIRIIFPNTKRYFVVRFGRESNDVCMIASDLSNYFIPRLEFIRNIEFKIVKIKFYVKLK